MFWQQMVNGITLGSTYSLIALGYTLIFGVLNIVNMAHGEIFMFGAFIGLMIALHAQVGLVGALIAAMAAGAVLGYLMEVLALRPLRRRKVSELAPLISTIGVSIFLESLALRLFGAEAQSFPSVSSTQVFDVAGLKISMVQIIILAISCGLMVTLRFWLDKTQLGKSIRATSENIETANLLGIDTKKIIILTVMLASALGRRRCGDPAGSCYRHSHDALARHLPGDCHLGTW